MTKYPKYDHYFQVPLRTLLAREERNQEWLARKLNVSPSTVSLWCTGKRGMSLRHAAEIANLFGISLEHSHQ